MTLTPEELRKAAADLNAMFESRRANAIKIIGANISDHPELLDMFEGESFSESLLLGCSSLRKGFYKVVGEPYYRNVGMQNRTFAANVLFIPPNSSKCFEYIADIGPMVNINAIWDDHGGDGRQNQAYLDFKRAITTDNNYEMKQIFFAKVYREEKLFLIKESRNLPGRDSSKQIRVAFLS